MARELSYLSVVWGVVLVIIILFGLIAKSAEVYRTIRQFLITVLIALVASLALSAALLLLFRLDNILVVMLATLMIFIIGHLGSREYERPEPLLDQEDDSDVSIDIDLEQSNVE